MHVDFYVASETELEENEEQMLFEMFQLERTFSKSSNENKRKGYFFNDYFLCTSPIDIKQEV